MLGYPLIHLTEKLQFLPAIFGFGASFLFTWFLYKLGGRFLVGRDKPEGVQKFHVKPTSRLGGVAIALGLIVTLATSLLTSHSHINVSFERNTLCFLIASMPVWFAGLVEDLTHKVDPSFRLLMAMLSAAWLFSTLGIVIEKTDVWPVDLLLSIPGAQLCITLLVVAGFTHSVNIVDGFHGLACGLVVITLIALAFMAFQVQDFLVMQMCIASMAVVFGFFVFNWPKGLIFLGDAGAYLLGFWVVELGILLVMRNPSISPMAPVVAGLLPLTETLFSMYRRKVIRNHPVNHPDALHLHTLVFRRLIFNPAIDYSPNQKNALNSRVAIYFWIPSAFFSFTACVLFNSTSVQLVLILSYFLMYFWLYKKIVTFKAPVAMRCR